MLSLILVIENHLSQALLFIQHCNSKENGNKEREAGVETVQEALRHTCWLVFVNLKPTIVTWEEGA